jgi:hypothetical protein
MKAVLKEAGSAQSLSHGLLTRFFYIQFPNDGVFRALILRESQRLMEAYRPAIGPEASAEQSIDSFSSAVLD